MFGVFSDTHYHLFSLFSGQVDKSGCNERLKTQLDATYAAAKAMKAKGCTHIVHAGDMFHVRGSISPVVLNHVKECYEKITKELELPIFVLAGNHDLETSKSIFSANASSALSNNQITIVCARDATLFFPEKLCMISWHDRQAELIELIRQTREQIANNSDPREWTLVIHAPLNSVIVGIPETGIDPQTLEDVGFGLVLSGHYHNHKQLTEHVFSVGALLHHNWGDIGSLAGYLLVDDNLCVTHCQTSAPCFIDFMLEEDDSNISGNYIRLSGVMDSDEDITEAKKTLITMGAKGVVASVMKSTTATSASERRVKLDSLETSVMEYATTLAKERDIGAEQLINECAQLLEQAGGAE